VDNHDWLAEQFEQNRGHLRGVAHRMLGSLSDADDAVQECWFRLQRTNPESVDNLGGWLTTVVARVCLDMLRSRGSRREDLSGEPEADAVVDHRAGGDPEEELMIAESLGSALIVLLETLPPAQRVAFVLHDMFAVPFDEIAPIVERSPAATRQLASRARRRVHRLGAPSRRPTDQHSQLVLAFQAASREGNFEALLALLDPDAEFRADTTQLPPRAPRPTQGAANVADLFCGQIQAAQLALIGGNLGMTWVSGGKPRVVFAFTTDHERITAIDLITDPERVAALEVKLVSAGE
jgi:RNA polymerase sigma factor (sigma-70 family)